MALTHRYVRSDAAGGGTGKDNSPSDAWTIDEAISNYAPGQIINVINDGAHSLSGNVEFVTGATDTEPILWRGRNESDTTPAQAYIETTIDGRFLINNTADALTFHNIDFVSDVSSYTMTVSMRNIVFYECSFLNKREGVDIAAQAFRHNTSGGLLLNCYLENRATGYNANGGCMRWAAGQVRGCKIVTPSEVGIMVIHNFNATYINDNIIIGNGTGDGMMITGMNTSFPSTCPCFNNTIYNFENGINMVDMPKLGESGSYNIRNNLFHTCSNAAIHSDQDQSGGDYYTTVNIWQNAYYNCGTYLNNLGTTYNPLETPIECTVDPCNNSIGHDFSLNNERYGGALLKQQAGALSYSWS